MKKLKYLIISKITVVFILATVMNSCETLNLDQLDSPNALQPSQADVDLFLNAMQISFAFFVENVSDENYRGYKNKTHVLDLHMQMLMVQLLSTLLGVFIVVF